MKTSILAALVLAVASPVLAQTPAPAAQPTVAAKATEAAGSIAGKLLGTAPAAKTATAPLVNINTASPAALDALPQIGDARTKAIIAGRPYKSTAELVDRKVLPVGVYDVIKDKIAVK
jgi:competence protein ComEA